MLEFQVIFRERSFRRLHDTRACFDAFYMDVHCLDLMGCANITIPP